MSVRKYFTEEEYLQKRIKNYKKRDYQIELSEFIFNSMENYNNAVIEAHTGSGKTVSYLIPIFEMGRKSIISTKTKELMSQLMDKDIKMVKEMFPDKQFSCSTLMGKKNYFCHYRFFKYIYPYREMYDNECEWYELNSKKSVITIDRKLNFDVLDKMTADSVQCVGVKCEYINSCSFYNAKDKAMNSDLVVTNHYMMLSDLAMKVKSDMTYNFEVVDNIIFDEAHSVVDIFPMLYGAELSFPSVMSFIKENRQLISQSAYTSLSKRYKSVCENFSEKREIDHSDRVLLDKFIASIGKVIEDISNETLNETFKKYLEKYNSVMAESGVRLAEPVASGFNIKSMPISFSEEFNKGLSACCLSAVFISATMSFRNSFDYFIKEIGMKNGESKIVGNGYNFVEKGAVLIPDIIYGDTNSKLAFYKELVEYIGGGILIIFNSIAHMKSVYEYLYREYPQKEFTIQNEISMLDVEFHSNRIVLGCAVVREGIDFNGKGLKCVVIDKLPFENFSDVYLKERMKQADENGNSFTDFYLPRAVIYFKQAIGRLIRSEEDYGIWVILDSRVKEKRYGHFFLETLKGAKYIKNLREAKTFLEDKDGESKA